MRNVFSYAAGSLLVSAFLWGCNTPIGVDVPIGPLDYTVSTASLTIPDLLRDPATMTLRRVPCSSDSMCPQLGPTDPAIRCVAMACDPDPFSFGLATDPVDLNANSVVARIGDHITRIEIRAVQYSVMANGLQLPLGPTDLLWGPATAATIDAPGVTALGTIPVLDLAASPSANGDVELDPAGVADLSNYLVNTARQIRYFVRPRIDVGPGTPLPSGNVQLSVRMTVHVEGQLVR